jgi:hypothetical protein
MATKKGTSARTKRRNTKKQEHQKAMVKACQTVAADAGAGRAKAVILITVEKVGTTTSTFSGDVAGHIRDLHFEASCLVRDLMAQTDQRGDLPE